MAVDAISDEPNLLRCEDHVIREHPDGRGWDIYVRTELLPSLPDYLRNHPHGEADIIRLGAGLCSALETCHRRGIVHGDIKPRNVFVGGSSFNEQVTYKLGDFGMAQFSAVDNTNDFMAPEVLCGAKVSPESDLYSVGMVLYWALNRRRIPRSCRCRRRRWRPRILRSRASSAPARRPAARTAPRQSGAEVSSCAPAPTIDSAAPPVEEFRAALLAVARRAAAAQPQQAQAVRREAPAPKAPSPRTHIPRLETKGTARGRAGRVRRGKNRWRCKENHRHRAPGSLVVVALVVLIIVMALQGGKSGVDSITLDHESAEIAPQDTLTLKATVLDASGQELTDETLTWSSSNAAVATVKDGVVTGVTEGKAKITVKAGKRSADCTITVTNDAIEVKSLKLDKDRAEMQIGDSLTLTATMQPANAPDDLVSWASSDPNIATVKKGIVVATSSGSVTITASAGSCTATCQITVQAPSRRQRHGRDSFGHARSRRHEDRHHHVPHPRAESRQPAGFREDLRGRRQRRLARPAGAHRQRHGRYLQRHGHGRRCQLHQRDPADHRRRRHDALRRLHRHRQGEQDHPLDLIPGVNGMTKQSHGRQGDLPCRPFFKLRLRPRYDLFHPVPYPDGVRSGEQATPFPHCAGTKKPLFFPISHAYPPAQGPAAHLCSRALYGQIRFFRSVDADVRHGVDGRAPFMAATISSVTGTGRDLRPPRLG
ncbi:MAG: Ig-like domain-containing protein [Oscillospiraceae bacterium]